MRFFIKTLTLSLCILMLANISNLAYAQLTATVTADLCAIRTGPSALDSAVMELPKGERVSIERKGTSWHMARYGALLGYVRASEVSIDGDAGLPPKLYATANRDVILRKKPYIGGTGQKLPSKTRLELIHYERGWFRVEFEDSSGYVPAADLSANLSTDISPPKGQNYAATALKKLIVYSGAGERTTALGNVPQGAKLDVLSVTGKFAEASYASLRGYVRLDGLRIYFSPRKSKFDETQASVSYAAHPRGAIVNTSVQNFTYEMLKSAITKLKKRFPDKLSVSTLGKSTAGRDIPLLLLGNPQAPKRVWVDASLHAREHMCTQIVMHQVEFLLNNYSDGVFEGKRLSDVLNEVCLYIVPMGNPDGVALCQRGLSSVADPAQQEYLKTINRGSGDFSRWKANIRGVDLVSNFDAKWAEKATVADEPAPYGYKGTSPLSEVESRLCANFIESIGFNLTISYHAVGGELYWWFGQDGERQNRDFLIAMDFADLTGYTLISKERSLTDSAGLKDWAIQTFKTPGITVELGPTTSIAPISIEDYPEIWERNKFVLWHAANLFYSS